MFVTVRHVEMVVQSEHESLVIKGRLFDYFYKLIPDMNHFPSKFITIFFKLYVMPNDILADIPHCM